MSNSRPYGRNSNRDWLVKQRMLSKPEAGTFAAGLDRFEAPDSDTEDGKPTPKPANTSNYPGYYFQTQQLCIQLRLEEFILWLIDPFETSYGTGFYSPVRISPQVAQYIKSHSDWDKIAVIESTQAHSRVVVDTTGDNSDTTVISEPSAYWLWRRKDWLSVAQHRAAEQAKTDAQRAAEEKIQNRYSKCIDAMKRRYPTLPFDAALAMIQEWEALQNDDPNAAKFLKFYGWYEITEEKD